MSFTNFGTGSSHSFRARYVEVVENSLLRYTDQFDDPSMPGVMEVTVTFRQGIAGTELNIVQANIPVQIPLEFCYLGWQESLAQLANLVEPEIPDGA
ncbi:MAG TPA: SRPBCC domain-containing protein, partial [Gemmatimonadales bacterium]|nr:SRPBCC domain-containing protein [Gemmatimonadales bacterium]